MVRYLNNNYPKRRGGKMSFLNTSQNNSLFSICFECYESLSWAYYLCNLCQEAVCAKCRLVHLENRHKVRHPSLTTMGCINCGQSPEGTCGYCPALLCQDYHCREDHEDKHFDTRSDEEKIKPRKH